MNAWTDADRDGAKGDGGEEMMMERERWGEIDPCMYVYGEKKGGI